MIRHQGKKISYMIFDNNIPLGQSPIKMASVDFATKELHIYDEGSFLSFFDKAKLDVEQSLTNEDIRHVA